MADERSIFEIQVVGMAEFESFLNKLKSTSSSVKEISDTYKAMGEAMKVANRQAISEQEKKNKEMIGYEKAFTEALKAEGQKQVSDSKVAINNHKANSIAWQIEERNKLNASKVATEGIKQQGLSRIANSKVQESQERAISVAIKAADSSKLTNAKIVTEALKTEALKRATDSKIIVDQAKNNRARKSINRGSKTS